jgi:translocation and assembly module TamA
LSCRIIFLLFAIVLFAPVSSPASVEIHVTVIGLDEPLYKNVMARLTIQLQKDNERLQANTVRRLHRQAKGDIRSALAPYGYYNPEIRSSLKDKNGVYHVEYTVDKGPPVLVKQVDLEIVGDGHASKRLGEALAAFSLEEGDTLDQDLYEREKKRLVHIAMVEGFLDAAFSERSIRINRQTNEASVHLVLSSGRQYLFGETTSDQQILEPELLLRYLPYKAGDPYNPAKLFELQSILYRTDFFSQVVVRGQVDKAQNFTIPVEIELTAPERLNKYSLGLGYATDTGLRGTVDWTNRLFNSGGHRMSSSFQLSERANLVAFRFAIPRRDPQYDSLVHSVTYQDRTWDDTTTQLLTAAVNRIYSSPRLKFSAGLELRDEIYDVGNTNGDSTLLVPSVTAGMAWADDIQFTKNGLQASVGVLGGVEGLISDTNFLQATGSGKVILSPFEDWRLIGRGSLGITFVDSIDSLPPSLRFYTGGDNSIRGYSYKSIGTTDSSGSVIGGRYLVVSSAEVEHVVKENWSLAAFWDVGSATDDLSLEFYQGAGVGVRFRLPFGQVRLDLASAITEDGQPVRVHLTVGGDL